MRFIRRGSELRWTPMNPGGPEESAAEMARRLRSLPAAEQLQVLREALGDSSASAASDKALRACAVRVLREDHEILDSLAE